MIKKFLKKLNLFFQLLLTTCHVTINKRLSNCNSDTEELNTSYLKEVALNHSSRLNTIQKEINLKQCFALIKNEERTHLQLGLYYLIKNKYTVASKIETEIKAIKLEILSTFPFLVMYT